jgi:hypothetical protein
MQFETAQDLLDGNTALARLCPARMAAHIQR